MKIEEVPALLRRTVRRNLENIPLQKQVSLEQLICIAVIIATAIRNYKYKIYLSIKNTKTNLIDNS